MAWRIITRIFLGWQFGVLVACIVQYYLVYQFGLTGWKQPVIGVLLGAVLGYAGIMLALKTGNF